MSKTSASGFYKPPIQKADEWDEELKPKPKPKKTVEEDIDDWDDGFELKKRQPTQAKK